MPYRLFFLGAAWYAVFHVLVWTVHLGAGTQPPAAQPFLWHGYEMVFGFAGAIICGFLLTASANWIGRPTVGPLVLLALVVSWLVARIAGLNGMHPGVALAGDGIALWGMTLALSVALVRAGNRRNYRFLPIAALLALAATGFHLATLGWIPDLRYPLLRGAVDLLLILMVVMGGRIIPFFTSRRLPWVTVENLDWLAAVSSFLVILAILGGWVWPEAWGTAKLTWFAALFLVARQGHWRPFSTWREPMLWILHLGYFWLALALFLRGGAMAWDWMPVSTALHAITVGGLGCLGLGMMARVALGHGGHEIRAPLWLVPAFVLVALAAIPRLLTPWPELVDVQLAFMLSGGMWVLAFGIYAIGYLPILLGPRGDEAGTATERQKNPGPANSRN